jgi:hypothetical protein
MVTSKPTQKQVYRNKAGGIKATKKTKPNGTSKVTFERKKYKTK